jgi:heat shock protein HtpX
MLHLVMLLGTLTGILLVVGMLIGGVIGTTIALVIAVVINLISYWYSDKIVLRMYGAKRAHDHELNETVRKLSHEANIPKPRLYLIDNEAPNAFATGRDPQHSSIAVTRGLLKLDDDEMEGVLAHEISHIKKRDVLVATMAASIGGAIAYLAQIGYWSLFFGNRRNDNSILPLILIIVFAPLAALLVRLAISRNEEYKADKFAALLTRNPKGLASALRKISTHAKEMPMKKGSTATSHMWIINPFKGDWFSGLFSTHPPIERRIERLQDMHPS